MFIKDGPRCQVKEMLVADEIRTMTDDHELITLDYKMSQAGTYPQLMAKALDFNIHMKKYS